MAENIKNVGKTITNFFPRINQTYLIESSIDHVYFDVYTPVNNYENDKFVEFRLPKIPYIFTDMSGIYLSFDADIKKRVKEDANWSPPKSTENGDHYDVSNAFAYTLFSQLSIQMNGIQVCNESNYALLSYIRLITQFPKDEIEKLGKLLHLEFYDKIQSSFPDDTYFQGLNMNGPIYKRLSNLRKHGIHIFAPLITDICQLNMYMLDNVEIVIKLLINDVSTIINTSQQEINLSNSKAKKYFCNLSNMCLHVKKIKPTENSYNAFIKTLTPSNNITPLLNYIFTSKLSRQLHLPNGQNDITLEMPFGSTIPEKIWILFQKYDNFNTKSFKENLLFLEHLNLVQIHISINGSTIYNIYSDFVNKNVAQLYNTTLNCLPIKNHLLTYDHFINGKTLLGFQLVNYDESADIRSPLTGVLKINLRFKEKLADPAIVFIIGECLSALSVNINRDIILNKS